MRKISIFGVTILFLLGGCVSKDTQLLEEIPLPEEMLPFEETFSREEWYAKYDYIEWDDPLRKIIPWFGDWAIENIYEFPDVVTFPVEYAEEIELETITIEPNLFKSKFLSTEKPIYKRVTYTHEQLKELGISEDRVIWGFYKETDVIIVSDEEPSDQILFILKKEGKSKDSIPLYVSKTGYIFRLKRK